MADVPSIDSTLKFGRYHVVFVALSGLPILFTCMQVMSQIFTLGLPKHRCAIPGWPGGDTYAVQSPEHAAAINALIPFDNGNGESILSSCLIHEYTNASPSSILNASVSSSPVACTEWVYDKSVFEHTAVSQMNLVCDRKMYKAHASMIYMVGYVFGVFSSGVSADRIGRKTSFCIWLAIMSIGSVAQAWAPNYPALMALRALSGFGDGGTYVCYFVLNLEMVSSAERAVLGFGVEYFWASGVTLLTAFAYGLRNWRHLQMAISFPLVGCLLYFWALPESPRWLISKGRTKQAEKILKQIARVNKRDFQTETVEALSTAKHKPQGTIKELITDKMMCKRALIVFSNWFVLAMVFYGLSFNLGNLGGDLYLNYFISSLVEFVAYTICTLAILKMNRRTFHCTSMMLGGIACILTLFPVVFGKDALRWLLVTLSMIGRLGTSCAFACIWAYTPELFPTMFRNTITGGSSLWARVGVMVAPYIAELRNVVGGRFGIAVPLLIFGGLVIVAAIFALFLPETRYEDLPTTVLEAKMLGRRRKKKTKILSLVVELDPLAKHEIIEHKSDRERRRTDSHTLSAQDIFATI